MIQEILKKEEINKIQYANSDNPHKILGRHKVSGGQIISAYHPSAVHMNLILADGRVFFMERVEKTQVYSVFLPEQEEIPYRLQMFFSDGGQHVTEDPYSFDRVITDYDLYLFGKGSHDRIYEKLGAHPMTINGVNGTYFAVWAPGALRVSVVGDFNHWDGRVHSMKRLGTIGVFELFLPGVTEGSLYKYEIKIPSGRIFLKADPYGNGSELRPGTASVVADVKRYIWNDGLYMKKREKREYHRLPMAVYEVHLPSWKRKGTNGEQMLSYRELAHDLGAYVKDMGYTHVELLGLLEHPLDGSWGYQVTGYYAPTARHGKAEDFKYFVDYLHQQGIGVIVDWVPGHFPKDEHGLARFDGTCLYENPNPKKGEQPEWGTLVFHYENPQVRNFLLANALFWIREFHVDGLRVDAVSSMLYLDYGRKEGEWEPNIFGGRENLEAVAFLRDLNGLIRKKTKGAFLIAEESTAWPGVSRPPEMMGLGFDFKWNMGWMHDFLKYMQLYPDEKKKQPMKLTFSFDYAYDENFIQALSHDEVVHLKKSMIEKMPGIDDYERFSNLRTAFGLQFTHPGKKLLFMGQDFGQRAEWNENRSLDWHLMEQEFHGSLNRYMKDLLWLYQSHKALYETDYDPAGFSWVNRQDSEKGRISFMRRSRDGKKSLLVVCNFVPEAQEGFRIGVPNPGKYTLILNSDHKKYGGSGYFKTKTGQMAKKIPMDGREQSIEMTLPPFGILIFEYHDRTV